MAITISVASGKGGVGKSMVACNLSLLLARRGKRVILVDLDVGGANVHILFGIFHPELTLSDFLYRRVETLEKVAQPIGFCPSLRIIPGTGDTLATANMPYARKKRLIRHLKQLSADIIVVDVGPGTGYHSLDFFLMSDYSLAVTTVDPTSVLDLYRFVKLAAIRRVLTAFVSRGKIPKALVDRDFYSISEILDAVGENNEAAKISSRDILEGFCPYLILNRVSGRWQVNTSRLRSLLKEYVGGELTTLGAIPDDESVEKSVRSYLPVTEFAPSCPATVALNNITEQLLEKIKSD